MRRTRADKQGFTLIEMLVVLAIMVVLMALVIGAGRYAKQSSLRAKARADIEKLHNAINEYRIDYGSLPQDIKKNTLAPWLKNEKLTYTNDIPIDPWNTPYQYERGSGYGYALYSCGADGLPRTADDIQSGK